MTKSNTRRFVSAAWSLLTFQMIASVGAVAVTGWAAFSVQPRLMQMQRSAQAEPGETVVDQLQPEPGAPVNTGQAQVAIEGAAVVGGRVAASIMADPDGMSTSPTFQWLRDGAAIPDATQQYYGLTGDDGGHNVSVRVDYADAAGFTESTTSAAATVALAPCQRVGDFLRVPANAGWCDTGMNLTGGRLVGFYAQGTWSNVGAPAQGPEGHAGYRHPGTIMTDGDLSVLIGRVGDAPPFAIGRGLRYPNPVSGRLFLSINDVPGTYHDNQGYVDVQISFTFID